MFSAVEVSEWPEYKQILPPDHLSNIVNNVVSEQYLESLVECGEMKLEELDLSRQGPTNELVYCMKLLPSGVDEKPCSPRCG